MNRIAEELGCHRALPAHARALSKQEVAAALCRAGLLAGLWSVPEFEIRGRDGMRRKIDVAWARREPRGRMTLWRPVAAFEIEGLNVAGDSIRKNVDSLTAAAEAGAIVRAMVLFQVGPDAQPWCDMAVDAGVRRATDRFGEALASRQNPVHEVVLDETLCERLALWVQLIASQQVAAADDRFQAGDRG